jgi:hypothetical protein
MNMRKMEWITMTKRIRNQTIRMELGIILIKEIIKLAHLRWSGHLVRGGDDR